MGLHQSDRRQDLVIELVFLEHDSRHRTEKPYKLQYDPGDEIPRWNCQNEPHNGIRIEDMRGREHDFSISTHGFQVMKLSSQLPAVDFYDDAKVKTVYYDELKTLLKASFRADGVEILEHGIRKRHPQFPVSTGEDYDHLQPTSVVHIDFTLDAALEAGRNAFDTDTTQYRRIQCVNIWKPLHGPVTDWPLAVCDVRTVDKTRDLMATDVVMRHGFTENYQVYHNVEHKWYYLGNQGADEVIVFRQTDTEANNATGVPHAGFCNPNGMIGDRPRESIEARAFLYYT